MQFTYYTDYSLRVLIYLAVRATASPTSRKSQSAMTSRSTISPRPYTTFLAAGHRSYLGKGDRIELTRDPAAINIGEVVRYTERPLKPIEYFDVECDRCVIANISGLADAIA